jgi:uncharacterized membrane protein
MAYFIGAIFQGNFWDPHKWNNDVQMGIVITMVIVWLVPIIINYLDDEPNFKD